jgi:hypothetical protein
MPQAQTLSFDKLTAQAFFTAKELEQKEATYPRIASLNHNSFPQIAYPGTTDIRWKWLLEGGGKSDPLEVFGVILYLPDKFPRKYYMSQNTTLPPDCSSPDGVWGNGRRIFEGGLLDEGVRPCASCPLNGIGTPCKATAPIYFLLLDPETMTAAKRPYRITVPRTSLKVLSAYTDRLLLDEGLDVHAVLTSFTLKTVKGKVAQYPELILKSAHVFDPESAEQFRRYSLTLTGLINRMRDNQALELEAQYIAPSALLPAPSMPLITTPDDIDFRRYFATKVKELVGIETVDEQGNFLNLDHKTVLAAFPKLTSLEFATLQTKWGKPSDKALERYPNLPKAHIGAAALLLVAQWHETQKLQSVTPLPSADEEEFPF